MKLRSERVRISSEASRLEPAHIFTQRRGKQDVNGRQRAQVDVFRRHLVILCRLKQHQESPNRAIHGTRSRKKLRSGQLRMRGKPNALPWKQKADHGEKATPFKRRQENSGVKKNQTFSVNLTLKK